MNTKEIQEQIRTLRMGRDYEPCPIEDSKLAATMQAMLKVVEAADKLQVNEFRAIHAVGGYTIEAQELMIALAALKDTKAQVAPESTLPVQPDGPDR